MGLRDGVCEQGVVRRKERRGSTVSNEDVGGRGGWQAAAAALLQCFPHGVTSSSL
jgi:hypothetical protein